MLTIFSICDKEAAIALKLAKWMGELGGCGNHECLLSVNRRMAVAKTYEPIMSALKLAFREVTFYVQSPEDERPGPKDGLPHVYPANNAFIRVNKDVIQNSPDKPFLWLEADAIPLTRDWMDRLWAEYFACSRPFMGDRVVYQNTPEHMSGVAIYKQVDLNCPDYVLSQNNAWDVVAASQILPKAHFTRLIQHEWRPDSFPRREDLSRLRPEAVLYHQCKDGSLIDRLREKLGVVSRPDVPSVGTVEKSELDELRAEIARLKQQVSVAVPKPEPKIKQSKASKPQKSKSVRTPEEQQKINERMAKARAGRAK